MPEERIPRRVWEWCLPGRRGSGRTRNTWMQEIRTGMKAKQLDEEDWNERLQFFPKACLPQQTQEPRL